MHQIKTRWTEQHIINPQIKNPKIIIKKLIKKLKIIIIISLPARGVLIIRMHLENKGVRRLHQK